MEKSGGQPFPTGFTISYENGHLVIHLPVDAPLWPSCNEETGQVLVDCPAFQVGTEIKAGIIRLSLSPRAAHTLLDFLHLHEKTLDEQIAKQPKRSVQ